MKKKAILRLIVFIPALFNIHFVKSQTEGVKRTEKTSEIGVYVAPGTHFLTNNMLFSSRKNFYFALGAFYQRPFSEHFKWRVGVAGMLQMANNKMNSSSSVKYSTWYLELPIQFQYIVNPQSNFKFYTGLGVTPRRYFKTTSTTIVNDSKSTVVARNNRVDMEVVPYFFIGLNAKINEQLSFYLQPTYSPYFLSSNGNNWVHYLGGELGLNYKLSNK